MFVELITASLIGAFLVVAGLGHVLVLAAIYKCLRDDYVEGRGRRLPAQIAKAAGDDGSRAAGAVGSH
jgi:hypothetical protein